MIPSPVPELTDVLVADPDVHAPTQYAQMLGLFEGEIVRAANGRDALVKALREPFALIIAETHLPLIDGYALCEMLRGDLATKTSPIVMVTSDSRPSVRARALRAGADALLVKPIDADALRHEAQRLILRSHELRDRSDRIRRNGRVQLGRSRSLLESSGTARRLSRAHQRYGTTRPPAAPHSLRCPSCDRMLTYVCSHVGGVGPRHPEQWDEYSCSSGCGRFEFSERTRTMRRI